MSADHQKVNIFHWYGIRPPETAEVAWGGRAIYSTKYGLDIPHDRQQWRGESNPWNKSHVDACLKELGSRVKRFPPSQIRSMEHTFTWLGWTCRYNTRASAGYLYIVIFPEEK